MTSDRCASCGQRLPIPATASERIPEHLVGWANQMAARFARPVYLVGSALTSAVPRDWDVRIVLSNAEFELRYGDSRQYEAGAWRPKRFPAMLGYYADMAKLTAQAVSAARVNVDFQVHPMRFAYRFKGERRRRLDMVEGLIDLFDELP
jgi:hypothetical protein